jgi:hypothetical protein
MLQRIGFSPVAGTQEFAPGVCERLQPYLLYHVVGQELALRQFSDAACDLIRRSTLGKNLLGTLRRMQA